MDKCAGAFKSGQVVQFPLTWGRDNAVQFYSDLVFQFLLLTGVVVTFWQLKRDFTFTIDTAQAAFRTILWAHREPVAPGWRFQAEVRRSHQEGPQFGRMIRSTFCSAASARISSCGWPARTRTDVEANGCMYS